MKKKKREVAKGQEKAKEKEKKYKAEGLSKKKERKAQSAYECQRHLS